MISFIAVVAFAICLTLHSSPSVDAFVPSSPSNGRSFGLAQQRYSCLQRPQPLFLSSEADVVEEEEVTAVVGEDAAEEEAAPSVVEEEASAEEEESSSAPEKRHIARERHTVFVGNTPFDLQESALKEFFEQHGKVQLVSMPRNRATGQARGFAFVDMSTEEEMMAVIENLDGAELGGRVVRVSKSVPKDELPAKQEQGPRQPQIAEGYKKIYMGNIPFDCTKEEIMDFYSDYGEVSEVFIPLDAASGNGRGFAFVTMKEEDADNAIEGTNGQEFGGRRLVVNVPLPKGKKAPERFTDRTKLYVGNLSFYTVRETLEEIFQEFGTVHDCYMPEDPSSGGSRGFGFVTMEKEAAQEAIAELDGCEVDGRIIQVNEAQPKRSNRNISSPDEEDGDDEDEE